MSERSGCSSLDGMRVLMTADALGGVLTYALTLAKELVRRGASVDLAMMGPAMHEGQRAQARALPRVSVHESTYALEWMAEPWDDVARAGDWLLRLERELAPDVVHLNGYCHGALGFRAPVLVVGHSCVFSWWEAVYGGSPPSSYDRYAAEVKRGLGAAAAVAAPSRAMLSCLTRHYGPLPGAVVVPNGVAGPDRSAPAAGKDHTVLAAGRLWDQAKNTEIVARVARRISASVRIAGCARHPQGRERSFPGAEVLGWLDPARLAREMDAASVFAHPARYEPFGLAPLEAALRGCALVLGDIPSLREVWADAAVYVPSDDAEALAAALEGYGSDEQLRYEHAERARTRASLFTPERMANGTVELYERMLSARARCSETVRRGAVQSCA